MMNQQWVEKYGKWAVVTGASDGIGKEISYLLAGSGLNVVIVARRVHLLDQLADELRKDFDVKVKVVVADLSSIDGVKSIINGTQSMDVGMLVAAAGYGTSGKFIQQSIEDEINMLEVNCRAVLALSHHFGKQFASQGRGGIILFSSLVAFQGVPLSANYSATKAYIQSLAEALHQELAPYGVDVLASAPGPIHSGFASRANMQMGLALKPDDVARGTLKALGSQSTVRPGALSKLLIGSLAFLPRPLRVRVMGQIMSGMTAHQRDDEARPIQKSA